MQRAIIARYGCMCLPPRGTTGLRLKTHDILYFGIDILQVVRVSRACSR